MNNQFLPKRFVFVTPENGAKIFIQQLEKFRQGLQGGAEALGQEATELVKVVEDARTDLQGAVEDGDDIANLVENFDFNEPLTPEEEALLNASIGSEDNQAEQNAS